jgi:hypothetical protein
MKQRIRLLLGASAVLLLAQVAPPATAAVQRVLESRQQLEPFHGITADGTLAPGLFPIRATGVSTDDVRQATLAFLDALSPDQRAATTFAVTDDEWRLWSNTSGYVRQGVSFAQMSGAQREAAFAMMRAGLSAPGFGKARDIMRLNHHMAELLNNFERYGEWFYHITVMGDPHPTEPWGWQLDGHHLVINYFVLGDQVVATPSFWGSEPVRADTGKYAGVEVMQAEERKGLALMTSLSPQQRDVATLAVTKTGNNALAQAFRDNLVLDYAGIRGDALNARQRELLLDLIAEYVHNKADGHARVKMEEVRAHLDATCFAWIGDVGPEAAFYYRVHSPVILIEFDHQTPVALPDAERGVPTRRHVHAVVRTPNGNDYGRDLLRQHYERHSHDPQHGHQQ